MTPSEIAESVEGLSIADKLRAAADLIDEGKSSVLAKIARPMAWTIVKIAEAELSNELRTKPKYDSFGNELCAYCGYQTNSGACQKSHP